MCEAGEASGTLDIILVRLAEFTESANELKQKIRSAMTYPVLMISMTVLILMGLFTFVIPQIRQVFDEAPELSLSVLSVTILISVSSWSTTGIFSSVGYFFWFFCSLTGSLLKKEGLNMTLLY